MAISSRISKISPSATLAIGAKAKQMKADGIDVVGFGAGEPDFDTPEHIKQEAIKALEEGFTKYTPASGTVDLKEAVCGKFKNENNLDYSTGEVLISCGAKHSIFNAILAMCNEGDEIIIPAPYWVSYPEMVKAAGAETVVLETTQEDSFKITPEKLEKLITPKTKLLILNSPSNPTGMLYSMDELSAISKVLVKKGVYCISDEIYEKIIYDGNEHISIASLGEDIKDLTITVNGVSKTYAMTGWRVGYAAGPKEIIGAMSNLQSHSTSNPTSIAQRAAAAAIRGDQEPVEKMVAEFNIRRNYIVERLNSMEGITCLNPQGAFYVFPDVSGVYGKSLNGKPITDSFSITEVLLDEAKVAVVPGLPFGSDDNLRLSYASSLENISKGLDRIEEIINKLE